MKAMIFAAGLGTRLRPLTDEKPKALVQVDRMPLLEIALRRLKVFGIEEVIINVHHFAGQVERFLKAHHNFGMEIAISDERDQLLNTGGGLKKARWFFENGEPFLVQNVDVLTTLDLKALYESHQRSGAIATLAVRNRDTSRYLLFDEHRHLIGWRNRKSGEEKWSRPRSAAQAYAFSGIQILHPAIFDYLPEEVVFSSIDLYLEAAKEQTITGYLHDEDLWLDVGKPPALRRAGKLLQQIELV